MTMLNKIKEASQFIQNAQSSSPEIGIVLGTGLGGLANEIEISTSIPYSEIPHFPLATVESHSGNLLFGKLGDKEVVAMQGRFHFYEGYSMEEVTFPIRVMKEIGVNLLILSNACGGLNPDYEKGDIMVIRDHIGLFLPPPLRGKHEDSFGPRFVDLLGAYDAEMIEKALDIARTRGFRVHAGVYLAVPGPHLETPAEYKMLRLLGADAVGMSTIPEVIAARQMGLRCFAISIVTDLGVEGKIEPVTLEKVVAVAMDAEPRMTEVMKELITSL